MTDLDTLIAHGVTKDDVLEVARIGGSAFIAYGLLITPLGADGAKAAAYRLAPLTEPDARAVCQYIAKGNAVDLARWTDVQAFAGHCRDWIEAMLE